MLPGPSNIKVRKEFNLESYVMISPEDLIKIYQKYDKSRKHLIFIDRLGNYDDSGSYNLNEGCRYRRYPLP